MEYHTYFYEGPVYEFDTCVARCWKSKTIAPSEAKAISNLTYQFKKKYKKLPNCKIILKGKLTTFSEGVE